MNYHVENAIRNKEEMEKRDLMMKPVIRKRITAERAAELDLLVATGTASHSPNLVKDLLTELKHLMRENEALRSLFRARDQFPMA